MEYIPDAYDGGSIELYLQNELQKIADTLRPVVDGGIDKRHVVPEKPRSGLFYADGADWNPGSGEGIYVFDEDTSIFDFVGGSGSTQVDSFEGRTGVVTAEVADYDAFFLTPAEGDAAYLGLTATAANSQLLDGIDSLGFSLVAHIHNAFDRASSVLAGANVFSNIVVADGITTAIATRALTAANIGAATAAHLHDGIADANLLDKTATETVSGDYIFTGTGLVPAAGQSRLQRAFLYLDGKEVIDGDDSWLRLNQAAAFGNGIYSPGHLRIDGGLQIGSTTTAGLSIPATEATIRWKGAGMIFHALDSEGGGSISISTAAPSGGVAGDIRFRI